MVFAGRYLRILDPLGDYLYGLGMGQGTTTFLLELDPLTGMFERMISYRGVLQVLVREPGVCILKAPEDNSDQILAECE